VEVKYSSGFQVYQYTAANRDARISSSFVSNGKSITVAVAVITLSQGSGKDT
jgi:hypothetical protein